jgi:hypothetical protein
VATPLNSFKTRTWSLRDSDDAQGKLVYTAPSGITGIILMAQIANVGDSATGATFIHRDVGTGTETPLVEDYIIQPKDAAGVLTGRLIVQENNQIQAYSEGGTGRNDNLKLTLSFLESLNG